MAADAVCAKPGAADEPKLKRSSTTVEPRQRSPRYGYMALAHPSWRNILVQSFTAALQPRFTRVSKSRSVTYLKRQLGVRSFMPDAVRSEQKRTLTGCPVARALASSLSRTIASIGTIECMSDGGVGRSQPSRSCSCHCRSIASEY